MTSSSPRKRRTIGWSSVAAAARPAARLLLVGALAAGCNGTREVLVTYFNGDHGVSLRHPGGWRTDQAEQEGVWYRYFLAPPTGAQSRSPVSVTLLAGPTQASLDEYAERYLAGHAAATTAADERQGLTGKSWTYASADGATRYRLLLFRPGEKVVGLYLQADAAAFDAQAETLATVFTSFRFERPELYPRREWTQERASLGVPESWRETKAFSGGGTRLAQFVSPALATDKGRGTVHASLTVTLEAVPDGDGLEPYYVSTRKKLGENFQVVSHATFKGGYVDVMRTETPIATSYIKRYYFAEGARGCSLSFEAREDVFPRASRWADYIASTLRFGAAQAVAR
jgi:hypothetical protein